MNFKSKKALRDQQGFTLVELMIVVIIIGILAAVAVPLYMGYVRSAKAASAQAIIGTIVTAEKVYHQRHGTFVQDNDFTDIDPATNPLNIDVRDATQNWTISVPSADAATFTVTATGVGGTEYAGIVVSLAYDIGAAEVWTFTENGVAFQP